MRSGVLLGRIHFFKTSIQFLLIPAVMADSVNAASRVYRWKRTVSRRMINETERVEEALTQMWLQANRATTKRMGQKIGLFIATCRSKVGMMFLSLWNISEVGEQSTIALFSIYFVWYSSKPKSPNYSFEMSFQISSELLQLCSKTMQYCWLIVQISIMFYETVLDRLLNNTHLYLEAIVLFHIILRHFHTGF